MKILNNFLKLINVFELHKRPERPIKKVKTQKKYVVICMCRNTNTIEEIEEWCEQQLTRNVNK